MGSPLGKTFTSGNNNTCRASQSQGAENRAEAPATAVSDFISWQRTNQAALAENEERIRRLVIDGLVHHLKCAILQGYSLQEAGDRYIRATKQRMPRAVFDAVRDALLGMGWTEKSGGKK